MGPEVNASLNLASFLLLLAGFALIRRKKTAAHAAVMGAALIVSTVFLISYVVHHAHAGYTRYTGTGWMRALYLTILFTHTVLAALVPIGALGVIRFALKRDWVHHRQWARVVWPVWVYVSFTGLLVYVFLYGFPFSHER